MFEQIYLQNWKNCYIHNGLVHEFRNIHRLHAMTCFIFFLLARASFGIVCGKNRCWQQHVVSLFFWGMKTFENHQSDWQFEWKFLKTERQNAIMSQFDATSVQFHHNQILQFECKRNRSKWVIPVINVNEIRTPSSHAI